MPIYGVCVQGFLDPRVGDALILGHIDTEWWDGNDKIPQEWKGNQGLEEIWEEANGKERLKVRISLYAQKLAHGIGARSGWLMNEDGTRNEDRIWNFSVSGPAPKHPVPDRECIIAQVTSPKRFGIKGYIFKE